MTAFASDSRASLLSELLLFHAVLGRGYISPFPVTRGMVFTSALPVEALSALSGAEVLFRRYHDQVIAEERKALEAIEGEPEHSWAVRGITRANVKEIKEKVSRRAHIAWSEEQTLKPTIVELLKTHYYGAFTYVDGTGSRLGGALAHPAKLSSDLGWVSLMEGTTEEMFIRAGATGGALIHSLTGVNPSFNFLCVCKEPQLEKLLEKVKHTPQGQTGIGSTIAVRGRESSFSGTTADTLYSLARRVFSLGDRSEEKRVKVRFAHAAEKEWQEFLSWRLPELIDEPEPPSWQEKLSHSAPTSPKNAVLFAARAAMVNAFLQRAEIDADGPLKDIELDGAHLQLAKNMAKYLYRTSSGQEGLEKRIKNLKDPREIFTAPHRVEIAKRAILEAIEKSPIRKLSRNQIKSDVTGATLGLLDELVRKGEIWELCGTEECNMGKTSRAYTLPKYAPARDPQDALAEFEEAAADYAEHPDAFLHNEALVVMCKLRDKALDIYQTHFLPVVSLSRMTKDELRMLPKLLDIYPDSLLLRGKCSKFQEPEALAADEDAPLDSQLNLWVRYKPNGSEFCDWNKASKLQLAKHWNEETRLPAYVP